MDDQPSENDRDHSSSCPRLRNARMLDHAARMTRTGAFERDLGTGAERWSDELFRIRDVASDTVLDAGILASFHAEADRDQLRRALDKLMAEGLPLDVEVEETTAAGRAMWVRIRAELVPDRPGTLIGSVQDISDRREAHGKIAHLATHDLLTGLPNRALFNDRLRKAMADGSASAVLCLDLDRFKEVNDTLGHAMGDALLRRVSERLRSMVRAQDVVARLGGDEFAILQVGGGQPTAVAALAKRIVEMVGRAYVINGHQMSIGVSIGVALAPSDSSEPDQILVYGDLALYCAKAEGRGTFRFFEPAMEMRMQARRSLELDLRQALARREFELYYQPQVDDKGAIASFEALIRWRSESRGLVSPAEFIPLAEELGLIVPITDWVLRTACREAMRWPDQIGVAVNISCLHFKNDMLVKSVEAALAKSGLPARRLEIEITETLLLSDTEENLATLHKIRAMGVKVAMDDFGIGYSSLNYLVSFPFDKIKIDRSFVRDIATSPNCAAVVRAITVLGTSLGMRTTAEGIETEDQLACVRAEGITAAQGYLLSRPVPASGVAALIAPALPLAA